MVCHSLSYYWKDTRLKVYIWQPFEARIIETWRPNSETPGLQFKYRVPTGVEVLSQLKTFDLFQKSESETFKIFNLYTPQLAAGSESERMYLLLLRWKVQKSAMKMWAVATLKMDNMDMLANIVQLLSGRSGGSWTWSSPFLACRWPPLESHFVPFFSCLALIKNFGPSWSKHTTKLTKAILFSWLARDHWHWELFYKCNQCNYKYTFVENLRTHKNIFFTNASNVTTNAFL